MTQTSSDPSGYRVGEPQETNALKAIEFEVLELGNTHLLTDIGKAFNVEPTLDMIKQAITQRFGEDAIATWLCDSPAWAQKRYGPGEAYKVTVPKEAIVGSDLGEDGKLWIWTKEPNRNVTYRLPLQLLTEIASDVASSINVGEIWLGGSQSPKCLRIPKIDSDIDFFTYPEEFDASKEEDWKKYAAKTASIDLSVLSRKYGHEISLTFLPKQERGQTEDQILLYSVRTIATKRWRLRVKAEGLVKEIREERAKHGL